MERSGSIDARLLEARLSKYVPGITSLKLRAELPFEIKEVILRHLCADFRSTLSVDPPLQIDKKASGSVSGSKCHVHIDAANYDSLLECLARLSLVSGDWHDATAPFLWERVRIGFPRSFEQLLQIIGGPQADRDGLVRMLSHTGLLSPPASREPSRDRGSVASYDSGSMFDFSSGVPSKNGMHIRQLSFCDFRTSGLRRTVRQGSRERFITPTRMLHLLRGTRILREIHVETQLSAVEEENPDLTAGRLTQVGLTEYMDSSITQEVLEELLLRGETAIDQPTISSISTPIAALDLCGCTSAVVTEAVKAFVSEHCDEAAPRPFPHLKRLGLFGASTLRADTLCQFVTAFTQLTHLDLSRTQASDDLLIQLAKIGKVNLRSLSLTRCANATGDGILKLLCGLPGQRCVTAELYDLAIAGSLSIPTHITSEQIQHLFATAPCFRSGLLRTLDLSSCPLSDDLLMRMPPTNKPHGQLVLLGLANCRRLTIPGVAAFLEHVGSSVEILDLTRSCEARHPFGRYTASPCIDTFSLHTNLINRLTKPSLTDRLTNLRIIELEDTALETLGGGGKGWCIIYGKGRRGWYVNHEIQADFVGGRRVLRMSSAEEVAALKKLTDKAGLAADNMGWNSAKLEVLEGHVCACLTHSLTLIDIKGRLGRETGLYSYHAFQV